MLGGEIKVVMTLDDNDFSIKTTRDGQVLSDLRRNIDQTNDSVRSMERHFSSLGSSFRNTIFTMSLLRFALKDINDIFLSLPTAVLKSAGEMERLTKLMEGMSKETSNAAKQAEALSNVKYVFNIAQNAPFEVKALTDAFVKMKSGGIDPTVIAMKAMTESVAKFGGNSDTLHRASIAIQQMAGKGVVSMEELRQQLGEAVPNAINLMAESAGRSTRQFAKLVASGAVEATGALNSMFAAMIVENYGASQNMMNTWSGMLSLLKTKFELFKVAIAGDGSTDGDFFAEAKKGLRELIGMFDTMNAKSLASNLGDSLAATVQALREVIKFFQTYGEEIKTTGELMLFYFGASKLSQLGVGIKSMMGERAAMYRAEIAQVQENTALKASALEVEAAGIRRVAAERYASAQQATQLAGKLYAEQARMAAQVEALEAKAPGWSQAKIARLNEEIVKTREAIVEIQTKAVAERQATAAMEASAAAADRVAAAVRAGTAVKQADIELIKSTTEHSKGMVNQLNEKAAAAVKATSGLSMLGKAMTGFNVVVNAFGGWITVAITALAYLGQKLYEFLNRWERAEEIAKRIRRGIADTADLTENSNRVEELNKKIAGAENFLKRTVRPEMGNVDPKSGRGRALAEDQKYYDQVKTQYDKDLKLRDDIIKRMQEQTAIIDKEEAKAQASAYRDSVVDRITQSLKGDRDKIEKLRQARDAEVAKLISSGASEDKVIAAEKKYNEKINASQKEAINQRVTDMQNEVKNLDEEMRTANEDQKRIILEKKEMLNSEVSGLLTEWKNYAKIGQGLGTLNIVKKVENQKRENPLVREAEALEGDLEQARLKLNNYADGVRDLARIRQESAISFLKEATSGKFDVSKGKNADTGAVEMNYFGDLNARKKYMQDFKDQVLTGKKTIEEFIGSLQGLGAEEQALALRIINAKSGIENTANQQKALGDASRQSANASENLNAAMVRLESEGMAKADVSMTAMRRHFERLSKDILQTGDDFMKFKEMRGKALADTAITTSVNSAADEAKTLKQSQLDLIAATRTVAELREAEHKKRLEEIEAQRVAQVNAIQKILDEETLSTAKREELQNELSRVQATAASARQAEANKTRIVGMTELEKLAVGWQDVTTQMNRLSGQWASTFIDNLAAATTGGKAEWRKMVADMAMQVYKVFLQKQFAEPIAAMIGGLGKSIAGGMAAAAGQKVAVDATSSAAGAAASTAATGAAGTLAASATGATTGAAQTAAVTAAMTTMTTETTAAMMGMTEAMGAFAITSEMSMAEMNLVMLEGMAEMNITVATAMAEMVTASATGAAFANGGIMTSTGPMPLKAYATGGIASSPQLALFGEGSMNEAYVPLPDGRSIPVTMSVPQGVSGGGDGGTNVNISIVVNKDGTTSAAASGDASENWQAMASKVKDVVRGELVSQQRPGGLLYK